ncbi:hypothetical protein GH733_018837 [Mirounga leonina]|nr:hypothetical protein GH733_018837 [Mirounga leonina]
MQHMAMMSRFCEEPFLHEVDDMVCGDVDMKFCDHMGMEILSPLFGTLHHGFYWVAREDLSYEHWTQSQAHIPKDQACHQVMVVNWANGIEAMWYDKSHLNRYLLDHKPTKVLSLEDLQDPQLLG